MTAQAERSGQSGRLRLREGRVEDLRQGSFADVWKRSAEVRPSAHARCSLNCFATFVRGAKSSIGATQLYAVRQPQGLPQRFPSFAQQLWSLMQQSTFEMQQTA